MFYYPVQPKFISLLSLAVKGTKHKSYQKKKEARISAFYDTDQHLGNTLLLGRTFLYSETKTDFQDPHFIKRWNSHQCFESPEGLESHDSHESK